MRVSVKNLADEATEADLRALFEIFGDVSSVEILRDEHRGVVDMPNKSAAREAITGLNGQTLLGMGIQVSILAPGKQQKRRKPKRRRRR